MGKNPTCQALFRSVHQAARCAWGVCFVWQINAWAVHPGAGKEAQTVGASAAPVGVVRPAQPGSPTASAVPGADIFADSSVLAISIQIPAAGLARLRRDPRQSVPATVREGKDTYESVAIHLKGATGSFRSVDDKPGLTLGFGKRVSGQRFHGLRKIHLNNSVEDPSYLNERIGCAIFQAAGVPAPRVGWATVQLNGRRLGLYVLKEGFSEDFLGLNFKGTNGNLYEGSGRDIDALLPRDLGNGPDDEADLKQLLSTVLEPDPARRWTRLQAILEVDRFLTFMAAEVMIGHRDGYCLARNNYRIYHDPEHDRLVFLPHGMDQLFGRADAPVRPLFAGLVATAVIEIPEGRRRYRERLGWLVTNAFEVTVLSRQADQWAASLRTAFSGREARAWEREVKAVKERLAARHNSLLRQLSEPELRPLQFENDVVALTNWTAIDLAAGGQAERGKAPDGRPALGIQAGPRTMASWRAKVLLLQGGYRFETSVTTAGVEALPFGRNRGAGLRVSGGSPAPPYNLTGTHGWTPLQVEFQVTGLQEEMDIICELRAQKGAAWFDLSSMRLVRRH